jgi:hypothetical protein
LLLHQAQEGVFHEAAAGEGGQTARFVDGQQMGVIKQDFEVMVLRGLSRVFQNPNLKRLFRHTRKSASLTTSA